MKKNGLRPIVLASLFATLSIILTQFLSFYVPFLGSNTVRIGFGHIPLLLSGLLLGPFYGAITGAVADFTGAIVFPVGGAYFPGFTVTAMLTGLLPGLLVSRKNRESRRITWLQVFFITLITELAASVLLNTFWLSLLYGTDYMALFIARLPVTLCMCAVYATVNYPLYRRISGELRG